MTPTVQIEGQRMRVRFDSFDAQAYRVFLQTKTLPEKEVEYHEDTQTYSVTAPARFAGAFGVQAPRVEAETLPLAGHLFDYQRSLVEKALATKRYAIWADCGLGKTAMFLEWARHVLHYTGRSALIFSPLSVIPQTIEEARRFYGDGLPLGQIESRAELEAWLQVPERGIGITNYEKMIPGVLNDLRLLGGVVCDESSILKTGGGVIKWNLIKSVRGVEYKLSCTATPAPNDTMEYASQAAFLEKLRTEGEILWTFFTRDKSGNWKVKPHAEEAFFRFMADWSIYLRSPARYGWRDNAAAEVPEPEIEEKVVPISPEQEALRREIIGTAERGGELILAERKLGVTGRNKLNQLAKGFLYEGPKKTVRRVPSNKPWWVRTTIQRLYAKGVLVWTVFDEESAIIMEELNGVPRVAALHGKTPEAERLIILEQFRRGEIKVLISKASLLGYGMNFQHCGAMVFSGWNDSYEQWYQAVRRAYRYGQKERLQIYIPYIPELEGHIYENILRKKALFERDTAVQEENYVRAMRHEND